MPYKTEKMRLSPELDRRRKLIIVNPESKRKNDEYIKEHWQEYAPTKEERNAIMREHRAYKHKALGGENK